VLNWLSKKTSNYRKMQIHNQHLFISFFPLLIFLISCNSQTEKKNLIAHYRIDQYSPVDSSSETLQKISQYSDWRLSLEEKNNFELTGTQKNVVGYWNVEKKNDSEYQLLLQGGGWTIYGRFDGTTIYFDQPYLMFDSLFSRVSFTKID